MVTKMTRQEVKCSSRKSIKLAEKYSKLQENIELCENYHSHNVTTSISAHNTSESVSPFVKKDFVVEIVKGTHLFYVVSKHLIEKFIMRYRQWDRRQREFAFRIICSVHTTVCGGNFVCVWLSLLNCFVAKYHEQKRAQIAEVAQLASSPSSSMPTVDDNNVSDANEDKDEKDDNNSKSYSPIFAADLACELAEFLRIIDALDSTVGTNANANATATTTVGGMKEELKQLCERLTQPFDADLEKHTLYGFGVRYREVETLFNFLSGHEKIMDAVADAWGTKFVLEVCGFLSLVDDSVFFNFGLSSV